MKDLAEYFSFEDFSEKQKEEASSPTGEEEFLAKSVIYQGRKNYLEHHREQWDTAKSNPDKAVDFKEKIVQEVRALTARWLRMQNVVFLAGAGTSVCAGGPKMNELAEKIKELFKAGEGRKTLQPLTNLLSASASEKFNFEEFLSYLSGARRCLEPSDRSFSNGLQVSFTNKSGKTIHLDIPELDDLIHDVEKAIAISCNLQLTSQEDIENAGDKKLSAHQTFIGKILSRDPTLGRVKLVTTNYDTLFEQAMDRLNVYYADGFTGTVDKHFNPACFGLDYYYPGEVAEGRVRRYDKFLHLYKLHGSITWRKTYGDVNDPFGLSFSSALIPLFEEVKKDPKLFENVFAENHGGNNSRIGLGILPTSSKYGETITMPYAHLFRAFSHALLEPQTVCFLLGYSGWDEHINRLIQDALSNPSFTLVIVDPVVSSWVSRLLRSDRCERIYCISGDWGQFHKFVDKLLPDVEQLKTQMDVAKTLRELQSSSRGDKGAVPNG